MFLLKNGTIDGYAYLQCVNAQGSWHFGDFCKIVLPNIGTDQKKVLPFDCGAPGTVPYAVNPALVIVLRSEKR